MKKRFALLLILVALLPAGMAGAMAQEVVATPKFGPVISPGATDFARRYPKTLAVLKADFPDDYNKLLATITLIDKANGKPEDKLKLAFVTLMQLRKQYAKQAMYAPDTSLKQVVALMGEFHAQVLKQQGPEICGEFAANGSVALVSHNLADPYADRLDVQSAAYFTAVVQAIENPSFHNPVTQDDWKSVSQTMVAKGGNPEDVILALGSDTKNPAYCSALAKFMLFTALVPGDPGERLRANFVQASTGY